MLPKFWIIIDLIWFMMNAIEYHKTKKTYNLIFAIIFIVFLIIWEVLMYAGVK